VNLTFVNATRRWGGVKSWTLSVAAGLRRRGHRIRIVLRPGTEYAAACREAGLDVRLLRFGPDWNPFAVAALHREFRDTGADLVLTNVSKDNRTAGPAARLLGIPVVQRIGGPGDITDRFQVRAEHARFVTHAITPAVFIKDHIGRFPWMDAARRVSVVHNGVDVERFRPGVARGALRAALGVRPGVPLLITTSQLTAIKGHRFLLEALAALETRPAPVAVLVGTGAQADALASRARDLGVDGRVRFLGFRRDLPELLDEAAIAVQPSLQEGFPNSVIEFMAAGKPIVASRLAGIPEAVEDGVHGVLVPPGDAGALARALGRLLGDAEAAREMGAAARRRAVERFSEPAMLDGVESVLTSVLRSRSRPGGARS
jgi:glycosyltransferase involved in cell wall biosynthesis